MQKESGQSLQEVVMKRFDSRGAISAEHCLGSGELEESGEIGPRIGEI